ncbi:MAG TPA: hypothetical protein VJQ59_02055 [Candidatus Sulfotelmatobacter sp.]|nr:hypothetical protein [Candidatus Sulfotelmatobacter sp.]
MPQTTDETYDLLWQEFFEFNRNLEPCESTDLDGILSKIAAKFTVDPRDVGK